MQNRHAEAEPYAAQTVRLNPRNEAALSNYALILMELGRHEEALAIWIERSRSTQAIFIASTIGAPCFPDFADFARPSTPSTQP